MGSKRWNMNEDVYLLHWGDNISIGELARDLQRPIPAAKKRLAYLKSPLGMDRARNVMIVEEALGPIASLVLQLDELGFDVLLWLDGELRTGHLAKASFERAVI